MDPDPYDGPIPGFHYHPASTPAEKLNRRSIAAFMVPAIGYGLLCATSPHELGVGLWAGVTLLLLPVTGGLILHSVGEECGARQRMIRGFFLSFLCFALYGMINMGIIHNRIQSASGSTGPFVTMLITSCAYGLVAGVVGGLCASLPERHEEHGW